MAKMEVLEMHYQRAMGFARGHAKRSAKEDKLKNVRLGWKNRKIEEKGGWVVADVKDCI